MGHSAAKKVGRLRRQDGRKTIRRGEKKIPIKKNRRKRKYVRFKEKEKQNKEKLCWIIKQAR